MNTGNILHTYALYRITIIPEHPYYILFKGQFLLFGAC
ncbi:hypothetical protein MTBSS4_30090 [Magnetospirillum sp. SS-4]|nr:hypothetical protein MTBSS4_30090 [Magnetospirillum sp. SS-4]